MSEVSEEEYKEIMTGVRRKDEDKLISDDEEGEAVDPSELSAIDSFAQT